MRKFRFVGDPEEYGHTRGLYFANIYPIDFRPYSNIGNTIEDIFNNEEGGKLSSPDWQEVTDSEEAPKPFHKDTDLGMFSAMFVQGLLSNSGHCQTFSGNNPNPVPSYVVEISIDIAKELIKQLNEEMK